MRPGTACSVFQVQKDASSLELASRSAALVQQATAVKNKTIGRFVNGIYVSARGTVQQADARGRSCPAAGTARCQATPTCDSLKMQRKPCIDSENEQKQQQKTKTDHRFPQCSLLLMRSSKTQTSKIDHSVLLPCSIVHCTTCLQRSTLYRYQEKLLNEYWELDHMPL